MPQLFQVRAEIYMPDQQWHTSEPLLGTSSRAFCHDAPRVAREARKKADPSKPVWQIHSTQDETKAKNGFRAFLPADFVAPSDKYPSHRADLIPSNKPDPGTLF